MLDGMTRLLPMADVGFVGLARDEESLVAATYANRLPAGLAGRDVFVLDPMLATGGTLETVIAILSARAAATVTAVCCWAPRKARTGRGRDQTTSRSPSGWSSARWTSNSTSAATSSPA